MCDECSRGFAPEGAYDASRLWRLARAFEAELAGNPASEMEWRIFMGRATGSLGFVALQRLGMSRRKAIEAMQAPARSGFLCERVN